uniref:WH1 domain-containing protein n=1 Tax=Panagrellus redivivus TaxID=6233 RepID=A0A7E4UMC7_PANRE
MCHLDRQSNIFRIVKALKYPKFTIHHSTTSHVCLITDNDSVRVEFSSVNLYNVEKVAGHNVVLLRVKQLRTYYHIDITRYYLLFGSEQHANVFFDTISKLVHAPRSQGEAFAPPMSSQTHPAYPLVLDLNDEVVAEDPSNAPIPPQLNESAEEAMMPFQRMIRDPSVAPIRRGPVRVIRAPPEMRRLRSRTADTPVNDVSTDEEVQASPIRTEQPKAVSSGSVNDSPEAVPPPRKRGRPRKTVAAAAKPATSQRTVAVSSQKKLKSILKSASQPLATVESTRRSARLRDKPRLQYDAVTHAPVLINDQEMEASPNTLNTCNSETTVRATSEAVDRNFNPDSSHCSSEAE